MTILVAWGRITSSYRLARTDGQKTSDTFVVISYTDKQTETHRLSKTNEQKADLLFLMDLVLPERYRAIMGSEEHH